MAEGGGGWGGEAAIFEPLGRFERISKGSRPQRPNLSMLTPATIFLGWQSKCGGERKIKDCPVSGFSNHGANSASGP